LALSDKPLRRAGGADEPEDNTRLILRTLQRNGASPTPAPAKIGLIYLWIHCTLFRSKAQREISGLSTI